MKGILGWGTYVPYRRLDRSEIAPVAGTGGGRGTRSVASYDEDATTMGVEAARRSLRGSAPSSQSRVSSLVSPRSLWFATATPTYLDKTNATALHAALRLDRDTAAFDALGGVRSGIAALVAALGGDDPALVVTSDLRSGRPGGPEEATGGDGAAAVLVGSSSSDDVPVLAELIGRVSLTEEFVDRWRVPGETTSQLWEERFGETRYVPLAAEALKTLLDDAGLAAADVSALVVAGLHDRACSAAAAKSGIGNVVDRLGSSVGNVGTAQPLLLLASALENAVPGDVIVLLSLADGADALAFRATAALASYRPAAPVQVQLNQGAPITYGRYLAWRGFLPVEPPRRPEPARPSSSAAARNTDWKFGLVGANGVLAEQGGTVTTYTIDRLAYSPSPPVVFAVVDFDDGTRLPVELTDVDPDEVTIGLRVEMSFRRLFVADGIANYFWKARPVRSVRDVREEEV